MPNNKAATAKAAPARKLGKAIAKPVAPAPVAPVAVAAPVVTVAAPAVAAAPAPAPRGVNRTIATVAAQRCNFGGLVSERDAAYLAFYAGFAKRDGGTVTVRAIAESGRRPAYNGSNKAHDAGVIQRLGKAGLIAHTDGHASFTFTDKAKALAGYSAAPVAPKA